MKTRKNRKGVMKIGILATLLTSLTYPLIVNTATKPIRYLWPNAKNSTEVREIIEEEKRKLGLTQSIELRIYEKDELKRFDVGGYIGKNPNGEGLILGANASKLDRILIRHELYHVANGDLSEELFELGETKKEDMENIRLFREGKTARPNQVLNYWFNQEPSADIYSITGFRF